MSEKITIRDIAGFCPENAIWKMMANVCDFLMKDGHGYVLNPDSLIVDVDTFVVEDRPCPESEFLAPEQDEGQSPSSEQMVWAIGATAYFMATGHIVFGGHGGRYQREHPTVPLPVMPKALQNLTPVLHKCLDYSPKSRVGLEELNTLAKNGWAFCSKRQREKGKAGGEASICKERHQEEKWPEKMIEI